MSWGVATQNGVSVSLASIVSLSAGVTEFSPADLFTGGVQGAWYDPSDYSTLFQDSAGTTPVTAVEQPVGLMLDKSQGLVLGSNVVVNGTFATDTDWTKSATVTISGGKLNFSSANVGEGATQNNAEMQTTIPCTWQVTFTVSNFSSGLAAIKVGASITGIVSANGTYTYLVASGNTNGLIEIQSRSVGTTLSIDDVIIKKLPGNHASQATAASRPVLRARYNLLTYSEQFDNTATWTSLSGTGSLVIAANTTETTDPVGGNTADKFTAGSTPSTAHGVYASFTYLATAYTFSVYAKAGTYSFFALDFANGGSQGAVFNLSNGTVGFSDTGVTASISAAGNGWYRCVITKTMAAGGSFPEFYFTSSGTANTRIYTAAGTETAYFWGADLRTGSSAGTYQRIAAATDYATAGFLPYLYFVTDDSFGTNSINFSATDKMSVCAGVTKLSDAALAVVSELSAASGSNSGVFVLFAPGSPTSKRFGFNSNGNAAAVAEAATTDTAYNAPFTAVLTGQGNISGDSVTLRANATQVGSGTADQGAGNYGNWPLFIGRRNNASLPFEGRIYQLIVCGKTLSASELASTEAYVATKTGVTL